MSAAMIDAAPSPWLMRFAPLIPHGTVLDLACGSGRHARWLAEQGRQVVAADRNQAALQALQSELIRTVCIDLEADDRWGVSPPSDRSIPLAVRELLQPDQFAGVVVTNYLHRPLLPLLFDSLIDGGVLIYETFAQGNAAFGKPSNPAFLLKSGELIDAARAASCLMHVVAYEDGYVALPRSAMIQRLCAMRVDGVPITQRLVL